jgi:membrane-associated phospholipid phosphatase
VLKALEKADKRLLRWLRTRGHQPPVEEAMKALGKASEWGVLWAVLGTAAAAADPPRRRRWAVAALIGPAAIGVNYAPKLVIQRERPALRGLPPLSRAPSRLSFPSAHAASSLAAATAMARIEPRARAPLYALAAAICVGRPYLGMHYPSDVLAGVAVGVAVGALAPVVSELDLEDRLIDLVNSTHEHSA